MDFDFTESQQSLGRKITACFAENDVVLSKLSEKADSAEMRTEVLKWLRRLVPTGYLSVVPDDAENHMGLALAREKLAAISPDFFLTVEVSTRIFGRLIADFGTRDQKEEILPALTAGEIIGAVALREPETDSREGFRETIGTPARDGYHVSGHKSQVVNAPVAHWIAVKGKTEKGIAVFLIKNDGTGIEVGNPLNTLGYAGCAISDILLDGCPVDSAYVMGPFEDQAVVRSLLAWEDRILTAASLGLMKRSMDAATAYAKGHKKTGKPLIAHQEVGFKLAEMLALWQTCQLLYYRWAWMADTKDRETETVRQCAKAFCAESAEKMASSALEVMAEEGFVSGNPAEQDFRNSKYLQISGTPTAQSRITIADNLLDKG